MLVVQAQNGVRREERHDPIQIMRVERIHQSRQNRHRGAVTHPTLLLRRPVPHLDRGHESIVGEFMPYVRVMQRIQRMTDQGRPRVRTGRGGPA